MRSLRGQFLMVQDLILALKGDNVKTCFILSGISFHNLGPTLDIASAPKCAVCMFLQPKRIPLLKTFVFLKTKNFVHNYCGEAICGVPAWVRWLVC